MSLFSLAIDSACHVHFVERSLETALLILNLSINCTASEIIMLFADESSVQDGKESKIQ